VLRTSWQLWISHLSYTLLVAAPVLLLEALYEAASVGVFSLGTTLIAVFTILNSSVSTLLMPRIAQLAPEHRGRLFRHALVVLLLVNALLLALFSVSVEWGITQFFGADYVSVTLVYVLLALGAVLTGVQGLFAATLIGSGRLAQGIGNGARSWLCSVSVCRSARLQELCQRGRGCRGPRWCCSARATR
jgi:O-antigen/teichoic acid export membrane protein